MLVVKRPNGIVPVLAVVGIDKRGGELPRVAHPPAPVGLIGVELALLGRFVAFRAAFGLGFFAQVRELSIGLPRVAH